ncbi:hypothetical protein OROGR_013037 [Orobanche gracilis]
MASSSSSLYNIRTVCVFAGATLGKDVCFQKAADNLGEVLAAQKIHIVYGGGNKGLKGRVAAAASLGVSKIFGVIMKAFADSPLVGPTYGNEFRVLTMHDRIMSMGDNADAFIVLPGGLDTLEDLFQMLSWAQMSIHQKPVGVLNVDGFFDGLLSFLDSLVDKGFVSPLSRRLLLCATTPQDLIEKFLAYTPEPDPTVVHIIRTDASTSRKRALDLVFSL